MKSYLTVSCAVFSLMLLAVSWSLVGAALLSTTEHLVWQGLVYSSGAPVTSPVLEQSVPYRIVTEGVWFYNNPNSLAADTQYYTTSSVDTWEWYSDYRPVSNHSFLQIDGQDADWGAFSNGATNHTYSIYYTGTGAAVTFKIVDWVDGDYSNNVCHLQVTIYAEITVGGRVVDSSPVDTQGLLAALVLASAAVAMVPLVVRSKKP